MKKEEYKKYLIHDINLILNRCNYKYGDRLLFYLLEELADRCNDYLEFELALSKIENQDKLKEILENCNIYI